MHLQQDQFTLLDSESATQLQRSEHVSDMASKREVEVISSTASTIATEPLLLQLQTALLLLSVCSITVTTSQYAHCTYDITIELLLYYL
jgi:hypothetical protein